MLLCDHRRWQPSLRGRPRTGRRLQNHQLQHEILHNPAAGENCERKLLAYPGRVCNCVCVWTGMRSNAIIHMCVLSEFVVRINVMNSHCGAHFPKTRWHSTARIGSLLNFYGMENSKFIQTDMLPNRLATSSDE